MKGMTLFAICALALGCAAPPYVGLRQWQGSAQASSQEHGSHRTGSFEGHGGLPLFEQSWHPEGTPRAVLVVHHGLKDHSTRYGDFAARLVGRGIAVYGFDMRGHGHSAGRRATLDDFDQNLGDLQVFMDRVRAREPGRPVFLLGHSVGGAVVTLFTLERRPNLAGLIVMAPAIRVDRAPIEAAATPIAGALTPNFGAVDVPDEFFSRSPEVRREMASDPLVYHPTGPARTAAALVGAIARVWAAADTLDTPVLGLHGTADRATDPRGTAELVRRARTTDRTLHLYRGLYHDLIHEPERDQVMGDVERWIDAHLPAPAAPASGSEAPTR